jgi:hypothetical protein
MKYLTVVIECDKYPEFHLNQELLGGRLISASASNVFEEVEQLSEKIDEITDAWNAREEKIEQAYELLDSLRS